METKTQNMLFISQQPGNVYYIITDDTQQISSEERYSQTIEKPLKILNFNVFLEVLHNKVQKFHIMYFSF